MYKPKLKGRRPLKKWYLLVSATLLFLQCISITLFSQTTSVTATGTVRGPDGELLTGVSVSVKGNTQSTLTDNEGKYRIEVPDLRSVLVFTYVGFNSLEQPVLTTTSAEVVLTRQSGSLNEVVVVGYGTQKRKDLTGAIATVNANDITAVATTNAVQAIQGKVAGVVISQNNWNPGAEATVRVRGTRSFNASNDPLYVIDGIPINRGLNEVNPTDIESMEILKDASATAIYGSRGANGVILITTKRGKNGKTSITYDGYGGTQQASRLLDIMNGAQYADFVREAYRNRSSNAYGSPTPNMEDDKKVNVFTQDPYVLESVLMGYDENGNYNPSKVRSFNWVDAVMRTGNIQNHQLSVSGGSEKTKVLISGAYFKNTGIMKGADYQRYSVRLNIDHQFNSSLKIGASSLFSSILENTGSGTSLYDRARNMNPLATPYREDGSLLLNPGNDALAVNPLLDINGGIIDEHRRNRVLSSLYAEAKLIDGLRYRVNFGIDYRTARDGIYQNRLSTPRNGSSTAAQYGGNMSTGYTLENLLFYNKKLGTDHSVGVTLLQSIQTDRVETHNSSVDNIPYDAQLFYNVGSASNVLGVASGLTEYKLLSYMGRINYGFKDKYLLTASLRSDGSSVLADGNKYAYFPSAALAWRVSDENFLQGVKAINELKLRVGYGKTGNSSINPYQTLGSLAISRYAWDESVILAFAPNSIPNRNLRWETTGQYNLGLDFSILDNRIFGSIDAYSQHTKDLLMSRQLPIVSGFGSILQNIGETKNRGIEVGISTINIESKKGFVWKTGWVFSKNKEEIVKLYNNQQQDIGNRWFVGQPISVFYDLQFNGIWQAGDKTEMDQFNANGQTYSQGLIRIKDQNGDYRINGDDRVILGSVRPDWMGSITNEFSYKGVDLSFQFYASWGQMAYFDKVLRLEGRWNSVNVDYWTPSNPGNNYPKPSANWETPPDITTTYYQDASFIRLRYITLGYNLPKTLIHKAKMSNCRIYISAQNPYLYTKFDGLDPEGGVGYTTPSPRTIMAGINLGF